MFINAQVVNEQGDNTIIILMAEQKCLRQIL